MEKYTVRSAAKSDIDVIVHQRNEMFRAIHPELAHTLEAYGRQFRRWAIAELRKKKLVCFLVEDSDGNVVAGGSIWLKPTQPSPRVPGSERPYLMSMYTEPSHRRKGLATILVRHAIRWSKAHGYRRLELHASDEGREVYARLGFERTWEMRLDLTKLSKN
ncbi:MAG TPA: GNAT family N-acetyltransferase [Nitrososphaerales archaeon]|nr:GNAT family N-acetyltransferase [Nitrososphaerales archaeon]